jgi:hypothetical protein
MGGEDVFIHDYGDCGKSGTAVSELSVRFGIIIIIIIIINIIKPIE